MARRKVKRREVSHDLCDEGLASPKKRIRTIRYRARDYNRAPGETFIPSNLVDKYHSMRDSGFLRWSY